MSESGSSQSISFKSKKRLMDSPCSKPLPENPNLTSLASSTPEKPPENMLRRSRNRGVALSVKEIRQAAVSRRRSEDPTIQISSAKNKLMFSPLKSSSSPSKRKNPSKSPEKDKLPEKYAILGKFFEALDNAIRLSKLKGSRPTFINISAKIEYLTERRFGYSHLAQLKHIMPEAIEIKRVLVFDEKTSCMKPDLHVTLNADAVEYDEKSKSESKNIALRKVFWSRLGVFVKTHPQDDEIPEELLPEPFNRKTVLDSSNVTSVTKEVASSSRVTQDSSEINVASTPVKATITTSANVASTPVVSTPAKFDTAPVKITSTPPELALTPARLISASLISQPQKASGYKRVGDVDTTDPPVKLARRSTTRSLNFDLFADEDKSDDLTNTEAINQVAEEEMSSDDETLSILPDSLLQSIKEQERQAMEDQNPAISQAKRRRKMIACLPKLFNVIHYLIQSIRRWVITKEELVHKIISGHSDITDRKEVEEQLKLMQEIIPEYMSEKKSITGDLLVCINKLAYPETIRLRLEEEKKRGMTSVT